MMYILEALWEIKWGLIAVAAVFALLFWVLGESADDCKARGGEFYQSGVVVTYAKVGDTLVPIQNPTYACTK
jgi:hypothetical protein